MIFKVPRLQDSLIHLGNSENPEVSSPPFIYKILVWNVYKGIKSNFKNSLVQLVSTRDLLLFQEVLQKWGDAHLHSPVLSPYQWRLGVNFHMPLLGARTGVALGSKWEQYGTELVRSPHREWHFWTPKTAILSRFHLNGKELLVVNCHAINFVVNKSYFEAMDLLAEKITGHQGPLLVAGDFNTWSSGRWRGLVDIFRNVHLEPVPLDRDQRWLKLDHIFVRDLRVRRAEVISDCNGSDHLPIVFDFELIY